MNKSTKAQLNIYKQITLEGYSLAFNRADCQYSLQDSSNKHVKYLQFKTFFAVLDLISDECGYKKEALDYWATINTRHTVAQRERTNAYAATNEPLVLKQEEPSTHCITADKTEQLETTHTNDKGISCRVVIFANRTQGGFEYWDVKTGGSAVYAEGGLWFTGKELSDYDGVYGLSSVVMETIEKLGFNADYAKD